MIDFDSWNEYYTNKSNIQKIVYECRYREVVIIRKLDDRKVTLRPLKLFKPEHFEFWYERLALSKTLFDIYISNASVKIPFPIPGDLTKLKEARERLNENFIDWVTGYDIFADIDIEEEKQRDDAETMAQEITHILGQQYSHVELWDTSRGYHVIVKGRFSPDFVRDLIMDICLENDIPMSVPMKTINDVRYVARNHKWVKMKPNEDTPANPKPHADVGIYDCRRIRRVGFSLHSKTGKPMVRIL